MRMNRAGLMSVFQKYFFDTCDLKFFSSRSGSHTLLSELVSIKKLSGKPCCADPSMIRFTWKILPMSMKRDSLVACVFGSDSQNESALSEKRFSGPRDGDDALLALISLTPAIPVRTRPISEKYFPSFCCEAMMSIFR